MTTGRNNTVYRFDLNGGNKNDTFNMHDECMREFRRSHPNVALVNGPRLDKADFLKRTSYTDRRYTKMTTGRNSTVYRFDLNGGNENDTFNRHNECMREFRRSHPNVALVNEPRLDKAGFLKRLPSVQTS